MPLFEQLGEIGEELREDLANAALRLLHARNGDELFRFDARVPSL